MELFESYQVLLQSQEDVDKAYELIKKNGYSVSVGVLLAKGGSVYLSYNKASSRFYPYHLAKTGKAVIRLNEFEQLINSYQQRNARQIYNLVKQPLTSTAYKLKPPITEKKEKSILQQAEEIINGSRAEDYGNVTDNFTKIAVGWKEIFADGNFTPRRVALAMAWLKICRDVNTPKHDNIVDLAGYAGCIGKMDNERN